MNKLGMIVALLQLGASIEAVISKDWNRAIIYFGFAIGSFGIAVG